MAGGGWRGWTLTLALAALVATLSPVDLLQRSPAQQAANS